MSLKIHRKYLKARRIVKKYQDKLQRDFKLVKTGKIQALRIFRSKNRCLNFFLKNNKWPKRNGETVTERTLATRLENYLAKTSLTYDYSLRRIVIAFGRKSNHKRKHDVQGFKTEILNFLAEHGRAPTTKSGEVIPGEGNLRHKLDYYTKQGNDMTFLGLVYKEDPCHRSGIPMRFRRILNQQLSVEKPLIRLVK